MGIICQIDDSHIHITCQSLFCLKKIECYVLQILPGALRFKVTDIHFSNNDF